MPCLFQISLKSFNSNSLRNSLHDIHTLFRLFQQSQSKLTTTFLPNKKKRITVLRSPHIDKKSRDQFEILTYSCFIQASFILDSTNRSLFFNLLRNYNPPGVGIKLQMISQSYLPLLNSK